MSSNGDSHDTPTETLRTSLSEACPACRWLLKTAKLVSITAAGFLSSRIDVVPDMRSTLMVHWFFLNGRVWTHNEIAYGDFRQVQSGSIAALAVLAFWTSGANSGVELPPWVVEALEKEAQ